MQTEIPINGAKEIYFLLRIVNIFFSKTNENEHLLCGTKLVNSRQPPDICQKVPNSELLIGLFLLLLYIGRRSYTFSSVFAKYSMFHMFVSFGDPYHGRVCRASRYTTETKPTEYCAKKHYL